MFSRRSDVALWAVALAALVIRLYDLAGPSVWLDETATRGDMFRLSRILSRVAFPPLYFLLLDGWAHLFGTGWWTLRVFSAVAGSLAVVVFGRVVLALFDSRPLMIGAAALVAIMPHSLQFSRETRMYSLWVLWLLIATLGAIRGVRAERPAARDLAAYWLGVGAAAATHHYTAIYVVALAAATYVLIGEHWLWKTRADWRRLAILHGPLVLAAFVEVALVLFFSGMGWRALLAKVAHDLRYAKRFHPLQDLTSLVFLPNWTAQPPFPAGQALLLASLLATAVLSWRSEIGFRRVAFLAVAGIAPLFVLSALPIRGYTRLLSPSVPFLAALLAVGAWLLYRQRIGRWLLVPVAALWIALLAPRVLDVWRVEIEPWKSVCADLAASTRKGGILLNEPYMRAPFAVCYAGPHPLRTFPKGGKLDPEWIRSFVRDKDLVWVVYAHAWRTDPSRRALVFVHQEGFRFRKARRYGAVIEAYLYLRHRQARAPRSPATELPPPAAPGS